jgi:hypothetical protein
MQPTVARLIIQTCIAMRKHLAVVQPGWAPEHEEAQRSLEDADKVYEIEQEIQALEHAERDGEDLIENQHLEDDAAYEHAKALAEAAAAIDDEEFRVARLAQAARLNRTPEEVDEAESQMLEDDARHAAELEAKQAARHAAEVDRAVEVITRAEPAPSLEAYAKIDPPAGYVAEPVVTSPTKAKASKLKGGSKANG